MNTDSIKLEVDIKEENICCESEIVIENVFSEYKENSFHHLKRDPWLSANSKNDLEKEKKEIEHREDFFSILIKDENLEIEVEEIKLEKDLFSKLRKSKFPLVVVQKLSNEILKDVPYPYPHLNSNKTSLRLAKLHKQNYHNKRIKNVVKKRNKKTKRDFKKRFRQLPCKSHNKSGIGEASDRTSHKRLRKKLSSSNSNATNGKVKKSNIPSTKKLQSDCFIQNKNGSTNANPKTFLDLVEEINTLKSDNLWLKSQIKLLLNFRKENQNTKEPVSDSKAINSDVKGSNIQNNNNNDKVTSFMTNANKCNGSVSNTPINVENSCVQTDNNYTNGCDKDGPSISTIHSTPHKNDFGIQNNNSLQKYTHEYSKACESLNIPQCECIEASPDIPKVAPSDFNINNSNDEELVINISDGDISTRDKPFALSGFKETDSRRANYSKPKRPCPFCNKFWHNLSGHFYLKHKEEPEVKKALSLPPNERKEIFSILRKRGIDNENQRRLKSNSLGETVKDFIGERKTLKNNLTKCKICKGFYVSKHFSHHLRKCKEKHKMSIDLFECNEDCANIPTVAPSDLNVGKSIDEELVCNIYDDVVPKDKKPLTMSDLKQYSRRANYTKPKRPCPFCSEFRHSLSRHFYLMHKDEPEVKRALSLPLDERRKIFDILRKRGIDNENQRILKSNSLRETFEHLISERKTLKNNFMRCSICKGLYVSKYFYHHVRICKEKHNCVSETEPVKISARTGHILLSDNLSNVTYSPYYVSHVLEKYRNDEVGKTCRNNSFLKYIGYYFFLLRSEKKKITRGDRKVIMWRMRLLCKLYLNFKAELRKELSFDQMFDKNYIEDFIRAAHKTLVIRNAFRHSLKFLVLKSISVLECRLSVLKREKESKVLIEFQKALNNILISNSVFGKPMKNKVPRSVSIKET